MNNNSLVALAYIKSTKNPLEVFCRYILYVLNTAPSKQLRVDELRENIKVKFNLELPQHMINVCTRILGKRKDISYLPNGAGFEALNINFDVDKFDDDLLRLHQQEDCVIADIVGFMKIRYNQPWTQQNAKEHLSTFLDKQGNGANYFMHGVFKSETTAYRLSPSWYIGRYVDYLSQDKTSLNWQYLSEIINGIMIYQGVYQTNDYEQDKGQKFKDTCFYFDTKLVLRAMGFSWGSQVQATNELIHLITAEYGGQVSVFEQTICEVENALASAGSEYEKGCEIHDMEIKTYATLDSVGASLLSDRSHTVREWLNKSSSFTISDELDWNSAENQLHTIGVEGLTEHIQQQHPNWRAGTIKNDVAVINHINVLRKGDYTQRYGGKKKLPVFITNNIDLVYSVRDYTQNPENNTESTKWSPYALPVISDNMLLFRLWVPVARKYSNIPSVTLSRYAYCAQNADSAFFAELRKKAVEYKAVEGVDLINLSDTRRRKLEDIIVTKTDGDLENITEPILVTSIEELVKLENSNLREELEGSISAAKIKDEGIQSKIEQIISLAAQPFFNKLRMLRCVIWCAKLWWIITAVVLLVCAYWVSNNKSSSGGFFAYCVILIPLIIELVLFIFSKYLSNEKIEYFLLAPAIRYVATRFSKNVRKKIRTDELIYADRIVALCLTNTKILKKFERFWPEELKALVQERKLKQE
jgi:hypothetical protein